MLLLLLNLIIKLIKFLNTKKVYHKEIDGKACVSGSPNPSLSILNLGVSGGKWEMRNE